MSKPIFSLLLFLFAFSLQAQEDESSNGFAFAIEIGPEFGANSSNENLQPLFEFKPKIGFTGNFIVTKYLFDSVHLKSGIGYKNKNFEFNFDDLIFGSCIDPISGVTIESSGSVNVQTSLHYIYFPVGIIYEISDNFNLDIGFDIDLLIHKKSKREISEPIKDPVLLTIGPDNEKVLTSLFLGAHIKLHDHIYIKPFANTRFKNDNFSSFFSFSNLKSTAGLKVGWQFR